MSTGFISRSSVSHKISVELKINGEPFSLNVDPRVTLLDLLREHLQLTGTKKGCDHGLCGACTVLVDGERVLSCLTLAASIEGEHVQTIEGMAAADGITELQKSFLDHDGFQCGYCTSGQICSAHAMLNEHARGDLSMVSFEGRREEVLHGGMELTDREICERLAGNICRCGAYSNIVAAALAVKGVPREII